MNDEAKEVTGATAVQEQVGKSARVRIEKELAKLRYDIDDAKNLFKKETARIKFSLDELTKALPQLIIQHNKLDGQVESNHSIIQQVFTFLGDIETRLEVHRTMGVRNDLFTEDGYDACWDEIKQLRLRGPEEIIEKDDYVRITYKAVLDGKVVLKDTNFPLKLGNNILLIESHLIGKKVGTSELKFDVVYPKNYHFRKDFSEKKLAFTVSIGKVKCKIKEDKDDTVNGTEG